MLKLMMAAIFLGATLPCFPHEDIRFFKELESTDVHPVYQRIAFGAVNLSSHEYVRALENFEIAISMLENSEESVPGAVFLIRFCQAIAYDNLGLWTQCEQTIGSMFLSLYAVEDEEENQGSIDDEDFSSQEDKDGCEFLRQLAALAHSSNVRGLLLDFVDGMED